MKRNQFMTALLCSLVLCSTVASAADIKPRGARSRQAEVIVELTEAGQQAGPGAPTTFEEFRDRHMTPKEVKMLTGISDAGYHFMGSAKIMAGIGKGLAKAMLALEEK